MPISLQDDKLVVDWETASRWLLSEDPDVQWQGAAVLYVLFLSEPECVVKFGNSNNDHREEVINNVLQLLATPVSQPLSFFTSCSDPKPSGQQTRQPAAAALQLVQQAQTRSLLLCILLQLSRADSFALKWQLYISNVPEVLLRFATLSSLHPAAACSELVKQLRPDVHAKIVDLHRLIPLAIYCICEATNSQARFQLLLDKTVARCPASSSQTLTQLFQLHYSCLDAMLRAFGLAHAMPRPYQELAKAVLGPKLTAYYAPEFRTFAALQQSAQCVAFQRWDDEGGNSSVDWLFPDCSNEAPDTANLKNTAAAFVKVQPRPAAASPPNWPVVSAVFVIAFAAGYLVGRNANMSTANLTLD